MTVRRDPPPGTREIARLLRRAAGTCVARLRAEGEERVAEKTVLMVDGRKVVRTMVTRHLARYACRVVEASDAVEAADAIDARRPDLIVLESALLEPLQADERCAAIPMVVLVSRLQAAEREPAHASAGRLLTPFGAQTFDREMRKFLGTPRGSAT